MGSKKTSTKEQKKIIKGVSSRQLRWRQAASRTSAHIYCTKPCGQRTEPRLRQATATAWLSCPVKSPAAEAHRRCVARPRGPNDVRAGLQRALLVRRAPSPALLACPVPAHSPRKPLARPVNPAVGCDAVAAARKTASAGAERAPRTRRITGGS